MGQIDEDKCPRETPKHREKEGGGERGREREREGGGREDGNRANIN